MNLLIKGIDISTAKETNIALSRTFYDKPSSPYSDCTSQSDSPIYRLLVDQFGTYRYCTCIYYCLQLKIINKCNCQEASFPFINSTVRLCSTAEDLFGCAYPQFSNFFNGDIGTNCSFCTYECNGQTFDYYTTVNSYPSKKYAQFLLRLSKIKAANITTYEQLKHSVLSLNIFYEQLVYTQVEQVPSMDILTLMSGIGGTMGLFLGMSFISFLEIIEVFIEVLYVLKDSFTNEAKSKPSMSKEACKKEDESSLHNKQTQLVDLEGLD